MITTIVIIIEILIMMMIHTDKNEPYNHDQLRHSELLRGPG